MQTPRPTRTPRRTAASLSALLLLAGAAAAQTGPFRDGELLVIGPDPNSSSLTSLYRIDAEAGDGEPLLERMFNAYDEPGGFAYDPYRDAILYYGSHEDTGLFLPRLFRIEANGDLTDLGFDSTSLGSFAPVGDGRVYMRQNGTLSLFDAADQLAPVLDANGQPITLELEHLVYDADSNSLIGVAPHYSSNPCDVSGTAEITFHALPLNAVGTQLSGPIQCTDFQTIAGLHVVGLDPVSEGGYVATVAGGQHSPDRVLVRLDPATMTTSIFASMSYGDVNGGVWCPRIQRFVVLDDVANELRTYAEGDSGSGQPLPVDVVIGDSTTGVSSENTLADVELLGSGCAGLAYEFGVGLAGSGGFVPRLRAGSCPTIDTTVQMRVEGGVGGGFGILLGGQATFTYSVLGGTGYVLPPFELQLPVVLGGTAGAPGQGSGVVPIAVPNEVNLLGRSFYFQAGILDQGAPANVSLTQALEVNLG